jgi:hypothetical protein
MTAFEISTRQMIKEKEQFVVHFPKIMLADDLRFLDKLMGTAAKEVFVGCNEQFNHFLGQFHVALKTVNQICIGNNLSWATFASG